MSSIAASTVSASSKFVPIKFDAEGRDFPSNEAAAAANRAAVGLDLLGGFPIFNGIEASAGVDALKKHQVAVGLKHLLTSVAGLGALVAAVLTAPVLGPVLPLALVGGNVLFHMGMAVKDIADARQYEKREEKV